MTEGGDGVALGPGPEFDRIRAVWRALGGHGAALGDDAALVEVGGERLAISTDLAIEGQHFRLGWLDPVEIGWRAAAAALSDLAAVAAQPVGVLASVGVPGERSEAFLTELMDGVARAAACVGAKVWGGDLVRSEHVTIDVVVVGRAPAPVSRAGARPGDGLWVTGRLGGVVTAVRAWSEGREPSAEARVRFAHPTPRIAEGAWLRDRGARAMIDLSDGLVGDAGHLAAASGVVCVIEADRVPIHAAADWESAIAGGEEYELLVALPGETADSLGREFEVEFGVPLTHIGRIEEGTGVRVVRNGQPVDVEGGFSHF